MYEMEGPLPASLLRPADHSASGRCAADHRLPRLPPEIAGHPATPRSEVPSGEVSFLGGEAISTG